MPNRSDFAPSTSPSKTNAYLSWIVLGVIALHLILLGFATFWHPSQQTPKHRSKVTVQTIRLSSSPSEIAQSPPLISPTRLIATTPPLPSTPIEEPQIVAPAPSIEEEASAPLPDHTVQKQELNQIERPPSVAAEIPPPLPSPVKVETKRKPAPPKPTPKEEPKKTAQPISPVKKTVETPKKAKSEIPQTKKGEEAEKKRQEEETLKKQMQEAAEKKKQQEKAESEKKRQQEIAAAQEAAKQKERILLAKAKENLAKMNETRDKISASSSVNLDSTAIPKELVSLHVDALPLGGIGESQDWGTKEASYSDEVAYRLKMALKLPDYGAVKIKLTLDHTGKVLKVETVKSESNKNKVYVESKILTLIFPSFGQKFQGVAQNTFEITLQNDS